MDIRRYLFEHEMTMREFARRLEITTHHLANIKKKKRLPTIPLLIKIIQVTNGEVGPQDLIPEVFEVYANASGQVLNIGFNPIQQPTALIIGSGVK